MAKKTHLLAQPLHGKKRANSLARKLHSNKRATESERHSGSKQASESEWHLFYKAYTFSEPDLLAERGSKDEYLLSSEYLL